MTEFRTSRIKLGESPRGPSSMPASTLLLSNFPYLLYEIFDILEGYLPLLERGKVSTLTEIRCTLLVADIDLGLPSTNKTLTCV